MRTEGELIKEERPRPAQKIYFDIRKHSIQWVYCGITKHSIPGRKKWKPVQSAARNRSVHEHWNRNSRTPRLCNSIRNHSWSTSLQALHRPTLCQPLSSYSQSDKLSTRRCPLGSLD